MKTAKEIYFEAQKARKEGLKPLMEYLYFIRNEVSKPTWVGTDKRMLVLRFKDFEEMPKDEYGGYLDELY